MNNSSDILSCVKCNPGTRQSCRGCPEYAEWLRRNYVMREDNARPAIHVEDPDVKRNFSDWEQYFDFQSKYMYNEDMDIAMDTTNQLKDEYPCSNCSFSVRQNCLGCGKLSAWMEKCIELSQDRLTELEGGNDMKSDSPAHAEGYGSKELDLIDSVNKLIRKYFADTHNDEWWIAVDGKSYPDRFTPVLVTIRDDTRDSPYTYTDVASYTGGTDGFWISNNELVCGNVVAWMKFPRPAEVR